jgi:aldehyde dehydrogenase (NAD+)
VEKEPVGVVAAIVPYNYPVQITLAKLVPALAAGCTVVVKAPPQTPWISAALGKVVAEHTDIPAGVVNVLTSSSGEVGEALVTDPLVDMVSFTGSTATGRRIMAAASATVKKVFLELGGKSAFIVMDDADLDLAVEGIVWSAFGTSGQRCTAASRVIAQERVYDQLQSKLVAAAERLRLGPGWEDDTDLGPVINREAVEKIHAYTKIGNDEGAKLLTGGEIASEGDLAKGFFYRPTIFGDVDAEMRIAQEEIFGPTTALIKVRDFDEAIRVANGIRYGLSSSIFTRDVNRAFRAMRDLQTGITYVNAGTTGAEVHLPFGGTKDTGNGHREAGQAALDVLTEWKSLYVDYSGRLQRAQIDNT